MIKEFVISSVLFLSVSGCSYDSAEKEYIYSLNNRIHQYHVYDSVTKSLIINAAYELKYDFDNDEYFMLVPILPLEPVTEDTIFTEFSFKRNEVIIIEADTGKLVYPGETK